jgi:RNA polymerase sigma-70 factor (ECF subfamily)
VYAFIRRKGFDEHQSQDLTQDFFARLLEKGSLQLADPQRGRFRSFLLTSVSHFLGNYKQQQAALKRGGGQAIWSFDAATAEQRYACEPAHEETAERLFDRRWGLTVLERALGRLRDEYAEPPRERLFQRLKPLLVGDRGEVQSRYQDIAAELAMTESAVKVAAHRLRKRFRELLHDEITQTVASPDEIEDEIRALFSALRPQ